MRVSPTRPRPGLQRYWTTRGTTGGMRLVRLAGMRPKCWVTGHVRAMGPPPKGGSKGRLSAGGARFSCHRKATLADHRGLRGPCEGARCAPCWFSLTARPLKSLQVALLSLPRGRGWHELVMP